MKRFWILASAVALAMGLMGCGTANAAVLESTLPEQKADSGSSQTATEEQPTSEQSETKEDAQMKIKITVSDTVLYATLEDNATTRAWTALAVVLAHRGHYECYHTGMDGTDAADPIYERLVRTGNVLPLRRRCHAYGQPAL